MIFKIPLNSNYVLWFHDEKLSALGDGPFSEAGICIIVNSMMYQLFWSFPSCPWLPRSFWCEKPVNHFPCWAITCCPFWERGPSKQMLSTASRGRDMYLLQRLRFVLHRCHFTSWCIYSRLSYENLTNSNRSDCVWQLDKCFLLKPSPVPLWDSTSLNYLKCVLAIKYHNITTQFVSRQSFRIDFFLTSIYFNRHFRQLLWLSTCKSGA